MEMDQIFSEFEIDLKAKKIIKIIQLLSFKLKILNPNNYSFINGISDFLIL